MSTGSRFVDKYREKHLLPSDCLEVARARNPDLKIDLVERQLHVAIRGSAYVLTVETERGTLTFHKGSGERWHDVFARAGLL